MSNRETPDEVIETDDGVVAEFDDADDVTEDDGADDDADGADDYAPDDDAGDADEDDADEGDSPDDELADREANEALVAEQFEEDGDAGDSDEDAGSADPGGDALVSRLRVIGRQPLAERAVALHQLHDELRAELESGDPSRR